MPTSASVAATEHSRDLLIVAFAALLVRAIYLFELSGTLPFSTLILDGRVFDEWAQGIAAGNWIGSEVFYQAPLYPYFLAVIFRIAGHHLMLVRIVQAGLSVCSCVFLARAGQRFFGRRGGLIAGLLLAFYPPAIFFDGLVQKAALDLFFITALLALIAEVYARRRTWPLLTAGIVLGFFTLNRENAGLIFPILCIWLWFTDRERQPSQRLKNVVIVAAGLSLILVPAVLRNYYVGGEIALTTSFGPNFFIGNHAGASGRYEPLLPHRADPRFERVDAVRLAQDAVGHPVSATGASYYWLKRGLDDVQNAPAQWLRLLGWKILLTFNSIELEDGEGIEVYAQFSWLLRILCLILSFGVILPIAVFGIWVTRDEWRTLSILYAIAGELAGSTALFFVFARYRFTFVPVLLLFAAAASDALLRADQRSLRAWAPGLIIAAVAALVANFPLPVKREDAVTYVNLGMGLLADGDPARALESLQRAVAIKPEMPGAHHNLGQALSALKRDDEAAEQFQLALKYAPDLGMSHAALGGYYLGKNLPDQALPHLLRAVELVPEIESVRLDLADLLVARNDSAGAVKQLREGLRRFPDSTPFANNLAWILATSPDASVRSGAEAVQLAESVVHRDLDPNQPRLSPFEEVARLDTLAGAYAEAGRYDEASATLQRAIAAAGAIQDPGLMNEMQSRLKLYQQHQPYHQPRT